LASFSEQAANLALCIVRQVLQPVVGNVPLDNAASPSLTGFDVSTQQSYEK
jgi:hypothetical protein